MQEEQGNHKYRCKCQDCRDLRASKMRQRRRSEIPDFVQHGLVSTYSNWGCRCAPCSEAKQDRGRVDSYGLSPELYAAILRHQDGRCANCGERSELHIDHAHDTGEVRGLLCRECNTGFGKLGDTLESLRRAVIYLETVEKRMNSAKISL